MKNLFLAFLLVGVSINAQSQTKTLASTPEELLQKSNSQYKAGVILLGGGAAMLLTAWAIPAQYDDYGGTTNNSFQSFLGVAGALSIAISVPVFLSSGNNARMAARLSLQNQDLYQPAIVPEQPRNIPAFSLKIPF
ncbi:hypothetical protein GCM10009119_32710 [Algoriphagus jejuensis]|uniref:Uncharacterized protein n=1 Tax=Algoriphagus jejuensis TaxID=419934 RepID=A0ABN1N3P8_9BACT